MIIKNKEVNFRKRSIKSVIIDNYKVETIKNVSALMNQSINKLYIIDTNDKKYLLKIINSIDSKCAIQSAKTQSYISEKKLAPRCIENINSELYTFVDNNYFILQEYINSTPVLFSKKDICSAIISLHGYLNNNEILLEKKKVIITFEEINNKINYYYARIQESYLKDNSNINTLYMLRLFVLQKFRLHYAPLYYSNIHGDLRPENIIFSESGPIFIDFDYNKYGDLFLELVRVFVLLSKYNIGSFYEYINEYNCSSNKKIELDYAILNFLAYLVQSNYPIRLIEEVDETTFNNITIERINTINFLLRLIDSKQGCTKF